MHDKIARNGAKQRVMKVKADNLLAEYTLPTENHSMKVDPTTQIA